MHILLTKKILNFNLNMGYVQSFQIGLVLYIQSIQLITGERYDIKK